MTTICSWGIRGGVGNTSVVAMLGDALHQQGESVLMVDLNSTDMLRLHFNVPYSDPHGWAAARLKGTPWQEQAFSLDAGLWLLPYGMHGLPSACESHSQQADNDDFWCGALQALRTEFSWVLFDLPPAGRQYAGLRAQADHDLLVVSTDAGCHILLASADPPENARIFVNIHDPARQLSNHLLLDWRQRYGERLLPTLLHRDEAVNAALAHKTTATRRFPDSTAADDMRALATLCMARRGPRP